MKEEKEDWTIIIKPETSIFSVDFREIWQYRDLLYIFIKKELISVYKQTILGPLWFFIQPILTTAVFVIVFGRIAGISTDNKPPILFYLSGIVLWSYFSDCFIAASNTFKENALIFGKVYFPRIVSPLSKVMSNIIKLFIQILLFFIIYVWYIVTGKFHAAINLYILYFPLLIIIMAGLSLGFGMIISSMTTKYKDLSFLVAFGVQLLMYATPVIYPLKSLVHSKYYNLIAYNPISPVIETFRYSVLGGDPIGSFGLLYSFIFMIFILAAGLVIFNKVEKSFADTI